MAKQQKVHTYHHHNGRKCIIGPDGIWRHWDNDGRISGPLEKIDWLCRMEHYSRDIQSHTVYITEHQAPVGYDNDGNPVDPLILVDGGDIKMQGDSGDRGDFGMPGIGSISSINNPDWTLAPGKLQHWPPAGKMVCTITKDSLSINDGETGVDQDAMTPEAERVLGKVPYILLHFLEKNAGYARAQTGHDLGIKGIIPDINRKTAALITQVWDGGEAAGDDVEELAGDLIGHLLLLIAKLED